MEAIVFDLRGETAFFKKPEVNDIYFTYSQIHKVALLGMLGAIVGFRGYNLQSKKMSYPQFYEELKNLKVGIVPVRLNPADSIIPSKKIQVFNNSVGYASQEMGGNLVIKEQWLEKPRWRIYIFNTEQVMYEKVKDYLIHSKCEYIPYLGKNDHFATIENVELIQMREAVNPIKIDSLYPACKIKEVLNQEIDLEEEEDYFKYQERLPIALEKEHNQYILEKLICTNQKVQLYSNENVYIHEENIIYAL